MDHLKQWEVIHSNVSKATNHIASNHVYTHMHTHMHTHPHAPTRTCTHTHTHPHAHAHTHTCTHTHVVHHRKVQGYMSVPIYTNGALPGAHLVLDPSTGLPVYQEQASALFTVGPIVPRIILCIH